MRSAIMAFLLISTNVPVWSQAAKPITPPKRTTAAKAANSSSVAEPTAVFDTTVGPLRCKLFEKETPTTVMNFIGLASGTREWKSPVTHVTKKGVPLYDGTIFHRVIPNFMIQGGDPSGNGTGDPGYKFNDEFVSSIHFDRPGRLAMANSGPNTNGSQFFITEAPVPHLDGHHTIFGQCDDASVALVKQIARMATDPRNDRPFHPVKVNHIKIERGAAASTGTPATRNPAAPAKHPAAPAKATNPN